ncbi:MAG: hypothetical protein Q9211_002343 [Gyalolechia sp. 1 TL-2023]
MSTCRYFTYTEDIQGASWLTEYHLSGGSDWEKKHQRASIAFQIITILALLGISIRAFIVRRTSPAARALFPWFIAAVSFAIPDLTWSTINVILNKECVYLAFETIFLYFRYVANLLFLAAVSILMKSFIARTTSKVWAIHLALCGILIVLCLVLLAPQLAYHIRLVQDSDTANDDIYKAILSIQFAYDLLYLTVVVDILALGLVLLFSLRDGQAQRKTPKIIFLLIGIALFVRQMWLVVIDGVYTSDPNPIIYQGQRDDVRLARQIFYDLGTIIVSAALVASMNSLQPQAEEPAVTKDMHRLAGEPIPYFPSRPEPSWGRRESYYDDLPEPISVGLEVRGY